MNIRHVHDSPFLFIPYEYMTPAMREIYHEYWDNVNDEDIENFDERELQEFR